MLTSGQIFKSYRQLCDYLGETPLAGNSKKSQLARWQTEFRFHRDGYKIIIDEVYETPKRTLPARTSHNNKHLKVYLPYIHNCLCGYLDERMSAKRLLCDCLGLLNEETLVATLNHDRDFFREQNMDVQEMYDFRKWLMTIRQAALKTVSTALEALDRAGDIDYEVGYTFFSSKDRTEYMAYTADFNAYIQAVEAWACDRMNQKYHLSSKMSGNRLKFVINQNRDLSHKYQSILIKNFLSNKELMGALQEEISETFYGVDFGSEEFPIKNYWKVWTVSAIEEPQSVDLGEFRAKYKEILIHRCGGAPKKWENLAF